MNSNTIVILLLFAGAGYLITSLIITRFFPSAKQEDAGTEAERDALYSESLGVRVGATMLELELARSRAVDRNSADRVMHLSPEDRKLAAIRLQQAERAFNHLSRKRRLIENS